MQIPPLAARPLSQTATPGPGTAPHVKPDPRDAAALKAAKAFEASFLEEMLKEFGINSMPESFGGGAGEEAFGSFLTGEYAKLLADRGGFGLAERVYAVLRQKP